MNVENHSIQSVLDLYELPFMDLLWQAQQVHRENFPANQVQLSTLLSIKTGGCPEDCGYCPQSVHYDTGVKSEPIMSLESVVEAAKAAKAAGATRFCMGAAWRSPKDKDLKRVTEMVKAVKALGMEVCATLGMLRDDQADQLKEAGLDYYNHNIDTSKEFYGQVIHTREQSERFDTLRRVRAAGLSVCCGGIVGMGESRRERAGLLLTLSQLAPQPESVPINQLVRAHGTPLAEVDPIDSFEFIRTIAIARILMPQSKIRLSAGREQMSPETQAWCFFAGANSIFYGEKLLTTGNPAIEADNRLLATLGITKDSASLCAVQ